ncbi:MAG: hypothetical protein K2M44_01825 [Clostridia bacterium]|nr:hypothetical protein [Clostridia bacterium]
MKKKLLVLISVIAATVCLAVVSLAGCKKVGGVPMVTDKSLADHDKAPAYAAYYQSQFEDMMSDYSAGNISAADAAAIMWALGSYNHGQAKQVVFFQDKVGETTLGGKTGKLAYQQYHKERRKDDSTGYKGEKYHYTIKHVFDSSISSIYENALEGARLRFVVNDTSVGLDKYGLYRFEKNGDTVFNGEQLFGRDLMTTEWKKGSDFGKAEEVWASGVVASNTLSYREVESLLYDDIVRCEDDKNALENRSILGNINVLEDGIVTGAVITEAVNGAGEKYYKVKMTLDKDKANSDRASIAMLGDDNSAKNIVWDKLEIEFEIWAGGFMKSYHISEAWTGTISQSIINVDGSASAENYVYYSYSDSDTSFAAEHEFLKDYIANN